MKSQLLSALISLMISFLIIQSASANTFMMCEATDLKVVSENADPIPIEPLLIFMNYEFGIFTFTNPTTEEREKLYNIGGYPVLAKVNGLWSEGFLARNYNYELQLTIVSVENQLVIKDLINGIVYKGTCTFTPLSV